MVSIFRSWTTTVKQGFCRTWPRGSRHLSKSALRLTSPHIVHFRNHLSNELIASRTLTKRAKFAGNESSVLLNRTIVSDAVRLRIGKMASRRPLLLRFNYPRTMAGGALVSCFTSVLFLASVVPLLAGLLIVPVHAKSQPPQYVTTVWHTEEGLPQNSVNAMLQDHHGYIWIGTFGGLARFDGERFTVFDSANTPGFGSDQIVSLYESRSGALWIGTVDGGLIRLQDGVATTYTERDGLPNRWVTSIRGDARRERLDQHRRRWYGAFCRHKAGSLSHSPRKSGPRILSAGAGRKHVVPFWTRCCAFRSRWLRCDPAFHHAERFSRTRSSRRKRLDCPS